MKEERFMIRQSTFNMVGMGFSLLIGCIIGKSTPQYQDMVGKPYWIVDIFLMALWIVSFWIVMKSNVKFEEGIK